MANEIIQSTPADFCVYLHRRKTTGEIFYVGKSKGFKRAFSGNGRNNYWQMVANKHGYTVEIVKQGMQEWWAFEMERELVAFYGRHDLGLGKLVNLSDGGDGAASGAVRTDEFKKNLAHKKTGVPRPEWLIGQMREQRSTDKRYSDMARKNGRSTARGVVTNSGDVFESSWDAARWLKTKGWPKADQSSITKVCKGKVKSAYGFQWRYADAIDKVASIVIASPTQGRSVICVETGTIFLSCAEVTAFLRQNGCKTANPALISSCCRGIRGSAYGLTWAFA